MPRLPGFSSVDYTSHRVNAGCQSCINLMPEAIESGTGKNSPVLYLTPGLSVFTTLPDAPIRCMAVGEGRLFVAAGSNLYEVFSNTTYENRGGIGNDGRMVQMFFNGNQLAVISNHNFYCDVGGVGGLGQPLFSGTTDPVKARQGAYLDGKFLAVDDIDPAVPISVRRFFHSANLDGNT